MIRVPDWAFEAAGQEMRGMGQDAAAYHPGLYLTPTQVTVNILTGLRTSPPSLFWSMIFSFLWFGYLLCNI